MVYSNIKNILRFSYYYNAPDIFYRRFFFDNLLDFPRKNRLLKEYLERYSKIKSLTNNCSSIGDSQMEPVVWQYWDKGQESAPEIVRRCMRSVEKYIPNAKIQILSDSNLSYFLDIPKFILTRRALGEISTAHYSDLIRLMVLEKYGGIWVDSTVLFTNFIPLKLIEQEFFAFSVPRGSPSYGFHLFSNWFLISKKNNPLIKAIKESLMNYWFDHNEAVDYFIFHLIASLLVEKNYTLNNIWNKVIYSSNMPPHEMQKHLFEEFAISKYKKICKNSFIHKLTYKDLSYSNDKNFYNFIVNSG